MAALNQTGLVWVALAVVLLLTAQAGFAILHAGMMRPKSTVNVAAVKVADLAIASLATWVIGFGLIFGRSLGGWLGVSGFFLDAEQSWAGPSALSAYVLFALLCATTATIVSGALGERMTFGGQLLLAALVATLVFPIFGHWVWAQDLERMVPAGWLARSGFVDAAGATAVHSLAGWIALAGLLVVGNRSGRYARSGKPVPAFVFARGAAVPLAAVGALLIAVGWMGAVSGSAIADLAVIPRVALAATLAAGAGAGVGLLVEGVRRGAVELEPGLRGMLAGLAAVSAAPSALPPLQAAAVGALAGGVMIGVDRLLVRLRIDDAVGAVPAHLGGGVAGTLAVALLGDPDRLGTGLHPVTQLVVQLEGVVVCAAWGFGITFLALRGLSLIVRLRLAPDEEFIGLNVAAHQASTELMDLMDALEETARHETPYVRGEPFTETASLVVAAGGAILRSTPAASAIFGYGERELRGMRFTRLVSMDDVGDDDMEALRAELDAAPREVRGIRRTGEEFPLEVSVTAGPEGEPEIFSLKDITARKESEESLTRLTDQIRRRLDRELSATRLVAGGGPSSAPGADEELPGGDVSLALPAARGPEWFGWFHQPAQKALTIYAGEIADEARGGAASLLSSVLSTPGYDSAADYTHGLLLGDARYGAERQLRNLAEVLNRIVRQEGRGELSMSMSFAHIDLATGAGLFLDAGRRTRALLKAGRLVKELGGAGDKLGAGGDLHFAVTPLSLGPGDVLLFVGEGLVDTLTPDGSLLKLGELKKVLLGRGTASEICDDITARARAVWRDPPSTHPVLVFQWRPTPG
jgi:ammonium transporter